MENKIKEILKAPYSRILIPDEDGTFAAEILEFPGCFSQGNSPNEAFVNLEEAAKAWIQASLEKGSEVPSPATNQGYSGKIALRIPRSLHRKAAQFAERDATSLNQFLITAIASRIGAEDYHDRLCNNFRNFFLSYNIANTISTKSTSQHHFVIIRTLPNTYIKNTVSTGKPELDPRHISWTALTYTGKYLNNYSDTIDNAAIALIPQETETNMGV